MGAGEKVKQKTTKLQKIEKKRFSILTNNLKQCYICKSSPVDIHEIYGGANRKTSMKNGFCIPFCRHHHDLITNNSVLSNIYKVICQRKFEETHSREEFIKIIGKNYINE